MTNPMLCERCGGELESDDAISIIEGVCTQCRTGRKRETPAPRSTAVIDEILDGGRAAPRVPSVGRPASQDFLEGLIQAETGIAGSREAKRPPSPEAVEAPEKVHRGRRRDLLLGAVLGLIILGGIAFYVLRRPTTSRDPGPTITRTSIFLNVQPATAKVYLDGEELIRPDARRPIELALRSDDRSPHWIDAAADGYHSYRQPVAVDGPSEIAISLIRKPYELAVQTDPPGAEVWINQELKGFTPLSISVEPLLRGTASIRKAGHKEQRVEIAPPEQGQRLALNLTLEAMGPVLHVESEPPGARVIIEGEERGVAPIDMELKPAMAGTTITVSGELPEHAGEHVQVPIPVEIGEPIPVRLALRPSGIPVVIDSDPPGAIVVIDGKVAGQSPLAMRFPQERVGHLVKIEALVPGQRHGEQPIILPETVEPLRIRVPMAQFAERIVFVAVRTDGVDASWAVLADTIAAEIHRLGPTQEFSLVFGAADGVDVWPEGLESARASSEQKVRAYDAVRSLRPSGRGDWETLLDLAIRFQPDAVWIFSAGPIPRTELERIEDLLDEKSIAISIVCTADGPDREWAEGWTLARRGLCTTLGAEGVPALAGDAAAEEP